MSYPSIHLNVGTSGSGKTHAMKVDAITNARVMPVLTLDRMAEWKTVPQGVLVMGTDSIKDAIIWLKKHRRGLAVVRNDDEPGDAFERACYWAIQGGTMRGVACSEIHDCCPNKKDLRQSVMIAATKFRHKQVALFVDTQRLVLLAPTIREQSTSDLKIFAVVGPRDLAVIKETWGEAPYEAVRECARRFIAGGGIEGTRVPCTMCHAPPSTPHATTCTIGAGWYVRPNVPPYRVVRDR